MVYHGLTFLMNLKHLATCFFRTADNVVPVAAPFQAVFACRHCVPCVERRMGHGFPHPSAKASSAECLELWLAWLQKFRRPIFSQTKLLSGEFHSRTTSYNSPEWGQRLSSKQTANHSSTKPSRAPLSNHARASMFAGFQNVCRQKILCPNHVCRILRWAAVHQARMPGKFQSNQSQT